MKSNLLKIEGKLKRKILLMIGPIIAILILAGCNGGSATESAEAEGEPKEESSTEEKEEESTEELSEIGKLFMEIEKPEDRLFMNVLGRPDGEDMIYHMKGSIYPNVPGDVYGSDLRHGTPLFGMEGYNIRKVLPVEGTNDIRVVTREIVFYTDLETGEILEEWTNPLTEKTLDVHPITNEYVNFLYRIEDGDIKIVVDQDGEEVGAFPMKPKLYGGNYVWNSDAFPLYNLEKLHDIDDPMNLKNNEYASTEFFNFIVQEQHAEEMEGNSLPKGSVPIANTWSRISPWVPWMGLDENEYSGNLVFSARSEALENFDELPEWIQEEVEEEYPIYMSAPETIESRSNTTSWTSFYYDVLEPAGKTWEEWVDSFD